MMNLDKWDKQTIEDWNQLGFYYELDRDLKQWRLFGSKRGLHNFTDIIRNYASNLSNEGISEHLHIGPYNYLKIMTWNEPIVTEEYIAGSLNELLKLSELLNSKLNTLNIGQVLKISSEYSTMSTATLVFIMMDDSFVPSSIEW